MILAAGFFAYANSFSGPFVYDDGPSITENATIRHLWPLRDVLHPPLGAGVAGRPVLNLSFALNYALSGSAVCSYHLVNVTLHVLAGLALFGIVRRTLVRCGTWFARNAHSLALCSSLLWLAHPVLTGSVTYVSQRAEVLMACWYLFALYAFIRAVESTVDTSDPSLPQKVNPGWLFLALSSCAFGMATKEVMATAPIAILLYDRAFIAGCWSDLWRRRRFVHVGFAATWTILAWLMAGVASGGRVYGDHASALGYAYRECGIVLQYALLGVWPSPLIFDSGPLAGENTTIVHVVTVLLFVAGAIALSWRAPRIGFVALWYFLLLAPTSSVVPLPEQPMAENRLYLPLAGLAVALPIFVFGAIGRHARWAFAGLVLVGVALGLRRNLDYTSEVALWRDTVAKAPNNARAYNNLGTAIAAAHGNSSDEIAAYEAALRLISRYVEARVNLASTLARQPGRLDEALDHFRRAVADDPQRGETYFAYGNVLARANRVDEAITILTEAKQRLPQSAEVRFNVANALLASGRAGDAMTEFEAALVLNPRLVGAHVNLGNLLAASGKLTAAIGHFETAVQLAPREIDARYALADAMLESGQVPAAIAQFAAAVEMAADNPELRASYAQALLAANRPVDALTEIEVAQHLRPDDPGIRAAVLAIRQRANAAR